jgi:hypothetical protein
VAATNDNYSGIQRGDNMIVLTVDGLLSRCCFLLLFISKAKPDHPAMFFDYYVGFGCQEMKRMTHANAIDDR